MKLFKWLLCLLLLIGLSFPVVQFDLQEKIPILTKSPVNLFQSIADAASMRRFRNMQRIRRRAAAAGTCTTANDTVLYDFADGEATLSEAAIDTTWFRYQIVTLAAQSTITGYSAQVREGAGNDHNVVVSLYNHNAGEPTTEIAGTVFTVAAGVIGGSMTEYFFEVPIPKTGIAAGTYCVVWRSTSGTTDNHIIRRTNANPLANDAGYSDDGGSTWTPYTGSYDFDGDGVFGCVE